MTFNVVKLRPIWYTLSGLMIGLSIAFLSIWGLRQGIDFTGGSLLVARFEARPATADIQQVLDKTISDLGTTVIQPAGDTDVQIRLKHIEEGDHQKIVTALKDKFGKVTELRFDAIGPVIGQELRQKAIQGLLIVLLAIMAYVAYVFRKVSTPVKSWKYGLITIFTAFHDVIVPVGAFAFLGHFYHVEIGTAFVAAILTILGYSITDTIVVFDRIRENMRNRRKDQTFDALVNESILQTMRRSLNTSATTVMAILVLYLVGSESIKEFCLALVVGITSGTYSSIFIASPVWAIWRNWEERRHQARLRPATAAGK